MSHRIRGHVRLSRSLLELLVASLVVCSIVAYGGAAFRTLTSAPAGAVAGPCQFRVADRPLKVALCETFDRPAGIGNRSGDLHGTLWGVSRNTGVTNFGQGQYNATAGTTLDKCGTDVTVNPPRDIAICNGQVAESTNDQQSVTSLAMYPKQPFDIAGRTGTIAFDVSDDSQGNHAAWPEIWYTDQPVPAPFVHTDTLQSVPRNGVGVRLASVCLATNTTCQGRCTDVPRNTSWVTVDSADVVTNYLSNDSSFKGSVVVTPTGCVKESSGPGHLNHFELRVSPREIDVYGTDAGTSSPLRKIAAITKFTLPLTRGLVWLEDVHYNGNKFGTQGTHTFTWDNFGFDGPTLPRDLAFDVLDRLAPVPGYPGLLNLGWPIPTDGTTLTVRAHGVYNIADAAGAILTFNYTTAKPVRVSYRVNDGSWHDQSWPFGACKIQNGTTYCGPKTIAVPVPLSDVQHGTNTIQFKSTDQAAICNIDLVLRGAA